MIENESFPQDFPGNPEYWQQLLGNMAASGADGGTVEAEALQVLLRTAQAQRSPRQHSRREDMPLEVTAALLQATSSQEYIQLPRKLVASVVRMAFSEDCAHPVQPGVFKFPSLNRSVLYDGTQQS